MSPSELEAYLYEQIPLSAAMGVRVEVISPEEVLLSAPLKPNINHQSTVFGGSASALAILSAWSLMHTSLRREYVVADLVIQRNAVEYEKPIKGEFQARASFSKPEGWGPFLRQLSRKGKARMEVMAVLLQDGQVIGRFSGDFVAMTARS